MMVHRITNAVVMLFAVVATASEWHCFWCGYKQNMRVNIQAIMQMVGA